jgi:hypothetical protein
MHVDDVAGKCLADIARHVIGYRLNPETRFKRVSMMNWAMCTDPYREQRKHVGHHVRQPQHHSTHAPPLPPRRSVRPRRYCTPRFRVSFDSRNEVSQCVG